MSKAAFFKWDSLLMIFMTTLLLSIILGIFKALENYDEGYQRYAEELNLDIASTFKGISECCKEETDY